MMPPQFEAKLPRTKDAPRLARRCLRQWMGTALSEPELDDAELLVTELVTNAVRHGHGSITLQAGLDDDRVLIEVIDEGEGFEREVRRQDIEVVGGRGLGIVDTVAGRWGIHEGTTHVWFELERPGPRLGASKNPLS